MRLVDGVYALAETIEQEGREATIHPAVVETARGLLLIDVGYAGELDQVADALAEHGHGLGDVWGVVVTHQDGDHAGALADLVDRVDPVVFAHADCAPYVDGRLDPIKGEGDRYPPVEVDVELADGVRFDTAAGPMEVVYTPGHTPGHVSLLFETVKLLLAADALTAPEGELAGPSEEFTPDMAEAIESVGRLADHDVEETLCYHGGFVEEGTGSIARIWSELAD
ncbi:MAG: MBL fold metallo-hydrolase [Halobacteriales archaeon]